MNYVLWILNISIKTFTTVFVPCPSVTGISPQWSAPTNVVADMARAPRYDGGERYPVGKVLSPASMTSGKNNSRHHHNISFSLRIPEFLWPCVSTSRGGCWIVWTLIITALCFVWIFPGLTMPPKLAWSPHFLRPFASVFAITPWNRETGGQMCPLVRGKIRDGIDLGRDKQYFKTKYTTCDTKVVSRTTLE